MLHSSIQRTLLSLYGVPIRHCIHSVQMDSRIVSCSPSKPRCFVLPRSKLDDKLFIPYSVLRISRQTVMIHWPACSNPNPSSRREQDVASTGSHLDQHRPMSTLETTLSWREARKGSVMVQPPKAQCALRSPTRSVRNWLLAFCLPPLASFCCHVFCWIRSACRLGASRIGTEVLF